MGMSPSLQGHCETRECTQRGLGPKEAQAGNYLRESDLRQNFGEENAITLPYTASKYF